MKSLCFHWLFIGNVQTSLRKSAQIFPVSQRWWLFFLVENRSRHRVDKSVDCFQNKPTAQRKFNYYMYCDRHCDTTVTLWTLDWRWRFDCSSFYFLWIHLYQSYHDTIRPLSAASPHYPSCEHLQPTCKGEHPRSSFSKVNVNIVSFRSLSSSCVGHQAARAGPHEKQRGQRADGEVLVFTRTWTSRDHPVSALSSHPMNTLYRRWSSLSASFNS